MVAPEYFISLCFIAAALLLQLAPPGVILSGFSAKAVWLVFAGIVFGMAVQQHNLGASMFQHLGLLRLTYRPLVWTLATFSVSLAFVIPSAVGRVLVLTPLVRILADQLGLPERANERYALYLTVIIVTTLPAFAILTSNVPNMVLLGTVETILGFTFTYPQYFLTNFPVLGIGTFFLATTMILRAFPGSINPDPTSSEPAATPPTAEQRRLGIILITTLLLWVTEELHTIAAAWVGLTMALICLAPRIGVLEPQTITKLNLGPWFFLAGVIAVGAVARQNGVADLLWQTFNTAIPLDQSSNFVRYIILFLFNMILGQLTTLPAAPSIFVPLIPPISEVTGWSQEALALATVPSFAFFRVSLPGSTPLDRHDTACHTSPHNNARPRPRLADRLARSSPPPLPLGLYHRRLPLKQLQPSRSTRTFIGKTSLPDQAATCRHSLAVSTSPISLSSTTCSAPTLPIVSARAWAVDQRTPANGRGTLSSRFAPINQYPPSGAGPMTTSLPPSALKATAISPHVMEGISVPMITIRPRTGQSNTRCRRAPKSPPPCAIILTPPGQNPHPAAPTGLTANQVTHRRSLPSRRTTLIIICR